MKLLLLFLPLLVFSRSLEVPFVRQKDHFCGPASLSSVLQYYGMNISQETIAQSVYDSRLRGALITDLYQFAISLGFKAETKQGNLQELKSFISRGIPPIILVDMGRLGMSQPHYMVVVGYKGDNFYVHTGYEESKSLSAERLDRLWSRMGRAMLLLYPP